MDDPYDRYDPTAGSIDRSPRLPMAVADQRMPNKTEYSIPMERASRVGTDSRCRRLSAEIAFAPMILHHGSDLPRPDDRSTAGAIPLDPLPEIRGMSDDNQRNSNHARVSRRRQCLARIDCDHLGGAAERFPVRQAPIADFATRT